MRDTAQNPENPGSTVAGAVTISHFLTCQRCGHEVHTYLACSDTCPCEPVLMPGAA